MRLKFLGIGLLTVLAATGIRAAGDDVPAWLQQSMAGPSAAYDKNVTAVVLLNDERVTVGENGRVTITRNFAVKILLREGRREAVAREIYQTGTGKVRDMHAWLIRSPGVVKRYGKDQTLDIALAMNDVYNEYRAKSIIAADDADAGSVFGYEVTSEDRSIFSQFEWEFQD